MNQKIKRIYAIISVAMLLMTTFVIPAFAADDPLAVINNLSDFIFSLIRAIGLILLGFDILQIGLALKSHDASQPAGQRNSHRGRRHCHYIYKGNPDPDYRGIK